MKARIDTILMINCAVSLDQNLPSPPTRSEVPDAEILERVALMKDSL
jgi:hypothetical protein